MRSVYINGQFVPEDQATLSIYDAAVLFAHTVTDACRTFNHRIFRLDAHLERLLRSLEMARIEHPYTLDSLRAATGELLERNLPLIGPDEEYRIDHNISAGQRFPIGSEPPKPGPTAWFYARPVPLAEWARDYEMGAHAVVVETRAIPRACLDPRMKCRNRMHLALADNEAEAREPGACALMLDFDGNITESTGANFFIVSDGVLRTAPDSHVLPGISRQTIFELAETLGLSARVESLPPDDVSQADEAFFTSTPYCLLPVTVFNGAPIGDGRPGPITRRLLAAWSDLVGVDIVKQALAAR